MPEKKAKEKNPEAIKIGLRIKEWRTFLGYKRAEPFAELLKLHISNLKKLESGHGNPGPKALKAFAATGVNINWLLTGEGDMRQPQEEEDDELESLTPEDMEIFNRDFKHIFEMLEKVDPEKREAILNEMLSRLKEAVRIQEMEEKLKALEARDK